MFLSLLLQLIRRQEEKIQEMIAVMQKAAMLDDVYYEQNIRKDQENISKLLIENKGLRELLDISEKFRSSNANVAKVSIETQTDNDFPDETASKTEP